VLKRLSVLLCPILCALAMPALAGAAATPVQTQGTVVAVGSSSFAVQAQAKRMSALDAMIAAANSLDAGYFPYVYGGGHAQAGIASIGIKGPGYNGHRIGFDCSGAVAAVLAAGGLWQPGSGVPSEAGMIAQLRQEHLIARGVGHGSDELTLYDDWGVHIFMNLDGQYFGTSDGGAGNPTHATGSPSWLSDGAPDTTSHAYKAYHFSPSLLTRSTNYAQVLTLRTRTRPSHLSVGQSVHVTYEQPSSGSLLALSVS
jgi:hypothetical protein